MSALACRRYPFTGMPQSDGALTSQSEPIAQLPASAHARLTHSASKDVFAVILRIANASGLALLTGRLRLAHLPHLPQREPVRDCV